MGLIRYVSLKEKEKQNWYESLLPRFDSRLLGVVDVARFQTVRATARCTGAGEEKMKPI